MNIERRLERALRSSDMTGGDEERMRQTILLARRELACRPPRVRAGFGEFLVRQIRLTGLWIWLAQGMMLLLACSVLVVLPGARALTSARHAGRLLCVLSGYVSMSAVPFARRAARYRMQEMETVTYFSSSGLLAARLALFGAGDWAMLAVLLALTVFGTPLSASSAALYLILPPLLLGCAGLWLLRRAQTARFELYCAGVGGIFLAAVVGVSWCWPDFFKQTFSLRWGIVCAGLLLACVGQLRGLLADSMNIQGI